MAKDAGVSYDEHVDKCAYVIRVMCSHLRRCHDHTNPYAITEHPLRQTLELFKPGTASTTTRTRRWARIGKPNPFPCFRDESQDDIDPAADSQAASAEQTRLVSRTFDGQVARALMDDGSLVSADIYKPGDNGMVEAHWLSGPAVGVKVLELPNMYCKENKIIPMTSHTMEGKLAASAKKKQRRRPR